MPNDCQSIRADRQISSTRQNFDQLRGGHGYKTMVVTSKTVSGSGRYETIVKYRDKSGNWRTSSTRNGNSFRADISPQKGFTPTVEVENMSDENLQVQVCLNYYK